MLGLAVGRGPDYSVRGTSITVSKVYGNGLIVHSGMNTASSFMHGNSYCSTTTHI